MLITGGVPPTERKAIQQDFHQSKQICVATEAAGEGSTCSSAT